MRKNFIPFITSILLIVCFSCCQFASNSNVTYEKKSFGDSIFFYDNNINNPSFVSYLNKLSFESLYVSIPFNDKELRSIKITTPFDDKITRFFCNCNSANKWSRRNKCDNQLSVEDAIQEMIRRYDYFYCGRVKISDDFESFLFARVNKAFYPSVDECLLVNKKGDSITCVASVSSHFGVIGHESNSFICKNNNVYQYTHETFEDSKDYDKKETVFFVFDKDGSIMVSQ